MPSVRSVAATLKQQFFILGGLLLLMWLILGLDMWVTTPLFDLPLRQYGLVPRNVTGLRGVVLMPFLHGGLPHLLNNSLPFLILGGMLMLRGTRVFVQVSLGCVLLGGLGTWVIGADGVHVGASGLIFGWFGFLLLRGLFERSLIAIVLALTVGLLYGGLLWGVLPLEEGVSWEGHLCGFAAGALLARLLQR